jgi:hypothetical protein
MGSHSRAFITRPYFPYEYIESTNPSDSSEIEILDKKIREYKIEYMVWPTYENDPIREKYAGEIVAGPQKFLKASRNPFNREAYELVIYKLISN